MATLARELRRTLERVVLKARAEAETGSRKALDQLAVAHRDPWPTMTSEQQALRRRLRARGRQLGDRLEAGGIQGVDRLVSECAYELWHRMLFARFLAECGLLIEPVSGVPVSVDECKELARARGADWISLASSFAQGMLPQIFRSDDAVLEVILPAEHRQPLDHLLVSLPVDVFLADDSLGWVYQFWQSEQKNLVNESEEKIGADSLPAVTQLFTEDYMVDFLLHNTLGAWLAGRRFPRGIEAGSEDQARAAIKVPGSEWPYLRFVQNEAGRWLPAAGLFQTWPSTARQLRVLDPCMGSGHFLVSALPLLVGLRRAEEPLSVPQAYEAVIRENLFGVEIDPRCAQIGAFNLALCAWKAAGWQPLSTINIACSGLRLNTTRADWVRLAGSDERGQRGMSQLYDLFSQAPVLGSLIDPRRIGGTLLVSGIHDLEALLDEALRHEAARDEAVHELTVTAQGVARAAEILGSRFTLIATNVPYLKSGKQCSDLKTFAATYHKDAKADLATCFIERSLNLCADGGTAAVVSPQSWLFQPAYRTFRETLLATQSIRLLAKLGPGAFETVSGEVVNVSLTAIDRSAPDADSCIAGMDASVGQLTTSQKQSHLRIGTIARVKQTLQGTNPESRIVLNEGGSGDLLSKYAVSHKGITTNDDPLFLRKFWELPAIPKRWEFSQSTVDASILYGGRHNIILYESGTGRMRELAKAQDRDRGMDKRGVHAWGNEGVAISSMGALPVTLYGGEKFDTNVAAIVPNDVNHLPAIWCFCESPEYRAAVRQIDHAIKVTNATLVKVPFDLSRWQSIAESRFPEGLPKPHSADPTQWLFSGDPRGSHAPLHVAVARLLGYRWPRQTGSAFLDCPEIGRDGLDEHASRDGIVCLVSLRGEASGAERLHALIAAAYGPTWSADVMQALLRDVGYGGRTLEEWLRDGFFGQHCDMFEQRPFAWHIWDGRKDGFSALVNCHKLTRANLEKLCFAYLGDWIRRQEASVAAGEPASESRLVAATHLQTQLKRIIEGEPPCDIFVRWKPLSKQPVGWEPDPEDGVRLNIRPFVMAADVGKKGAGVLRIRPNIKWDKDRGREPSGRKEDFPWFWGWDGQTADFCGGSSFDGNRWNDLHYSREFKMTARRRMGRP